MTKIPIVILHGWGADSTRFGRIKELLQAEGRQVWVPDLPGFGTQLPPSQPWNLDNYADWVLKGISQRAWGEYVLMGHSFGGRIAIKITTREPFKVKVLILASAAGIKRPRTLFKWAIYYLTEAGKLFFSLPGIRSWYDYARWMLYRVLGEYDYYRTKGTMRETMVNVIEEDLRGELTKISAPTLLLWGETDRLVPLEDGKLMETEIPHARLKVFLGQGHLFLYYQPEKVVKEVLDFLNTVLP